MEVTSSLMTLLGLTEYEGRVYRALLSEHPATAYRLGKRSGVPLSRVYEIAHRLVEKGAATVMAGEPAQYVPVPPETLVNGARNRASRQLDALATELSALFAGGEGGGHGWIRGEQNVLARAASLATEAKAEILLAAAPAAREPLQNALGAGGHAARVRAIPFASSSRGDTAFLLLIDEEAALIGRLGREADALSTRHPVLARLCADYFRLRDLSSVGRGVSPRRRVGASGAVGAERRAPNTERRHPTPDVQHPHDWLGLGKKRSSVGCCKSIRKARRCSGTDLNT